MVRPTIRGYFFKHYLFVAVFSLAAFALLAGSLLNWLMIDLRIGQGVFGFALLMLLFSIGYSYLHRRTTSLQAIDDRLEHDTGVIKHTKQKIPIRMITDTVVERGFLDRVLGVSTIKINTSGGMGYEVTLGLVDKKEAARFHDALFGIISKGEKQNGRQWQEHAELERRWI